MASISSPRPQDTGDDIVARPANRGSQSRTNDHRRYVSAGKSPYTVYMPTASPPTPAPSPAPSSSLIVDSFQCHLSKTLSASYDPANLSRIEFANLVALGPASRKRYLVSLLNDCTPSELLFISQTIAPMLRRDFLAELPPEIALHILSFVDDPKTLARASQVSKRWHDLVQDEWLWKIMCGTYRFSMEMDNPNEVEFDDEYMEEFHKPAIYYPARPMHPATIQALNVEGSLKRQEQSLLSPCTRSFCGKSSDEASLSYRKHFQNSYVISE